MVAAQQFMLNGYAAARTPFAIHELLGLVATNCDVNFYFIYFLYLFIDRSHFYINTQ